LELTAYASLDAPADYTGERTPRDPRTFMTIKTDRTDHCGDPRAIANLAQVEI